MALARSRQLDLGPGGNAIWANGLRLDNGKVGAACAWRTPSANRWTGRRFHLGSNKEMFDAEVYAIYQALSIMDQRQESGRRYTLFVDPTSAISRIRSDIGPGQPFAIASIEVATWILARDNEVTVRWVPAHHEVPGNERADVLAKAAMGVVQTLLRQSRMSTDERPACRT